MISLDFETRSKSPIRKVGGWRYAQDPTTSVLCMAWAYLDEEPQLWLPDQPLPEWTRDPNVQLSAWNAQFEYAIWLNCFDVPPPDWSQWVDPSATAASLALPRALGQCAEVLGLPADQQKDKRGRYLIQRLCQPYRGKWVNDTALLDELYEYCKQDVVTERAVRHRLQEVIA